MKNLSVTIIQSPLVWQDVTANLNHFAEKIDKITEKTDLIVLPEMFTTGFSMESQRLAETMDGSTMQWLAKKANEKNCVITGSIIIKENNKYYNRLIWMKPDGSYASYDKRHLFRFAGEDEHFSAGNKRLIVDLKGWKICPLICFDLRFPVWSRNTEMLNVELKSVNNVPAYDLLIYVANWPEIRNAAWKTLLQARAHENQCFVVGVNRVGVDANNIQYSGDSVVIDPKGNIVSTTKPSEESIETVQLNLDELNDFRAKFPVALDADVFKMRG